MITALVAATAVWLWAGVPASAIPASARTVYVYQGVIAEQDGVVRVVHCGVHPHGTDGAIVRGAGHKRALVPVVRLSGRPPAIDVARQLTALARAWEARGHAIAMVQLDHDAPSRRLGEYADFVRKVRAHLDRRVALSVTGLADWLVSAPPGTLERLAKDCDEVVIQLYHERHAVPQLSRYDHALAELDVPFKLGLLADMQTPPRASRSAHYRGSIVFLLREEPPIHAPHRTFSGLGSRADDAQSSSAPVRPDAVPAPALR